MDSAMTDSTDSILSKPTVAPQTIPEGKVAEHSVTSPTEDVTNPLGQDSSLRSLRISTSRPTRIPNTKRTARRSGSGNASASPAHAFLSSWSREGITAEPAVEPKPDDRGQAIGPKNEYIIGREISRGGFGVIKEVHSISSSRAQTVLAVKIVHRSTTTKDDGEKQQELEHEVSVWRHLDHRHILRLHEVYDTEYATYCVMDLNVGGTLFDVVRKSRSDADEIGGRKGLAPKLAKAYAHQLACALRYLHEDVRICHRDVKLENCLIDMSTANAEAVGGNLRLCDFGLADFLNSEISIENGSPRRFGSQTSLKDYTQITTSAVIGTLEYASPKGLSVHRKLFETAGDVWAFGVIVYALCTGELPFRHPMPSKTVELILRANWDNKALKQAATGSDAVIELVKGCLERDIDERFTIGDALRSSWFEGCTEERKSGTREAW